MIARLFWILTFFSSVFGGVLILGALGQDSAPKQAASAALGCGFAIIPYVLSRAASELSAKSANQEAQPAQPTGRRLGVIAGVTLCVIVLLALLALLGELAGQIAKFIG